MRHAISNVSDEMSLTCAAADRLQSGLVVTSLSTAISIHVHLAIKMIMIETSRHTDATISGVRVSLDECFAEKRGR